MWPSWVTVFFQIQQQDGTIAYTRDGAFKLSGTGQLVTSTGFLLEPNITIPNNASSLTIGRDGTISVELVAGGGQQVLGQLLQPGTVGAGVLNQGSLEASNVNVVEEMVNMIETQRAYEINSKSIESVDGMLKYLNQNL